MIKDFKTFINSLNEGLITTYDIDTTLLSIRRYLSIVIDSYKVEKYKNSSILLTLSNFNELSDTNHLNDLFGYLCTTMINQLGWFPSYMYLTSISGMENEMKYNESYLKSHFKTLSMVKIIYEAKFDDVSNMPKFLYHASPIINRNKISKLGLIPKRKQKLALHDNRIYVCKNKDSCIEFVKKMRLIDQLNNNIVDAYDIYKIDSSNMQCKLYNDPNFKNKGFYVLENIHPNEIKLIETIKKQL